jgi:acyl-CoA dehydrogenase
MDFAVSQETQLIVDTVGRFVAKELQPLEAGIEETGILEPETARAIFEKSRALGLYGMNMPEELGGGGLSAVDM